MKKNITTNAILLILIAILITGIFSGIASAADNITINNAIITSSNSILVFFNDPGQNLASANATKWHVDLNTGGFFPLNSTGANITNAGTPWTLNLIFIDGAFSSTGTAYDASHGLYVDAAGVTDLNGDTNAVIAHGSSIAIADGQAPSITSSTLTYGDGVLTVTASEVIDVTAVDPGKFHLNNVTGINNVTLTGATVSVTNASTFTINLTETQRVAALAISNVTGGDGGAVVLDVDAGGVTDMATNANSVDDDNTVTETADDQTPSITSATLTYGDGVLTVTANEIIDVTAVDPGKFHLNNVTGIDNVTLTGATVSTTNASTFTINLTETQRVAALAISNVTGGDGGAVVLDVDAGGVTDMAINQNLVDDNNTVTETGDVTAPTITNVSSSTADGSYKTGETIVVTVTFSESVTVTGTPQITLETGSVDRVVNYTSGSGTTVLTFNYSVQAGDATSDLDYNATNALALNGGTIKDAATNVANLTLASPGAANSLAANKAIIIDTTAPTLTSAIFTDDALIVGENTTVTFMFSENVSNFINADLTIANGELTAVVSSDGGTTWTATFTPTDDLEDSTNIITVNMIGLSDAAGNAGLGSNDSSNYAIDTREPILTITTAPTSPSTTKTSLVYTFEFNENVTGFTADDITLNSASAGAAAVNGSTFATIDANTYTLTLAGRDLINLTALTTDQTIVASVNMTALTDIATNTGLGATENTWTYTPTPIPSTTPPSSGGVPNLPPSLPQNVVTIEEKGATLSEPSASITLDFAKGEVMSIMIDAKDMIDSVFISVQKLEDKPVDITVSAPGKVYSYIDINVEKVSGEIAGADIVFKVENKWLSQNNIARENVMLVRFSGGVWQQLDTSILKGDDDFVYFSARTPGFSTFAIVSKEVLVTDTVAKIDAPVSVEEPAPEVVAEVPTPAEEEDKGLLPGFGAIFAVMGLLIVALLVRIQRKTK